MGGIVKGIKKVFKAVGSFVKKYWKVIVIAAAIYFTAGMAAGAMAPAATVGTTGVAAGVEAGAGYGAVATGVAAGATEGSMATALGITTAEGYGAAAAGMSAAEFTAAGGVAAGVGLGAEAGGAAATAGVAAEGLPGITSPLEGAGTGVTDFSGGAAADVGTSEGLPGITSPIEGSGYGSSVAQTGAQTGVSGAGSGAGAGTGLIDKATGAVKGFWGGMSTGEKLMFASTAFNAISGALKDPTRAEQGLWPGGAYFGMDEKGNKTDLAAAYKAGLQGQGVPGTTPPATAATAQPTKPQQPGDMQAGGSMDVAGTMGAQDSNATTQGNNLPTAAAGAASGSDFLPAAGSGAANMQRANTNASRNLAQGQTRNEKFFDDLRDRLDANRT